jgi:hypothetical protein
VADDNDNDDDDNDNDRAGADLAALANDAHQMSDLVADQRGFFASRAAFAVAKSAFSECDCANGCDRVTVHLERTLAACAASGAEAAARREQC